MNEILGSLSFVSAGAASALLSAIWQGAVLAVGVHLYLRMLPRLSAAARSVVWLNVFVLLVLLHFVPAFAARYTESGGGHVPAIHLDPRWSLGIAGVWLALSMWRAVHFALGIAHLRGLARRAVPIAVDAELQALLADAPSGRAAQLCASDDVVRPSVLGFLRPRILVPSVLAEHLTAHELHQVVLHEMEHLRRGDDWTNLLQKIGLVLFPLNPVLLWVERRVCAERELACDDRVIRSSAGRKAYALCLTRLAELSLVRRSFSLVLGLWERRPELVRRVQRIASQPVRSMGRRPAMAAMSGVLAGALGCAIVLSHSPQLVSFLPAPQRELAASSLDPHEVARELGGTPQLMKATIPAGQAQAAGQQVLSHPPVHRAVMKPIQRPHPAASQVAGVNRPAAPAPLPALDQRAVIVLTEVTTFQAPPRVVLAVSPDQRRAQPVVMPATYAILPTPNGWLIIQI
jgi:BlaR1 peptidase M56